MTRWLHRHTSLVSTILFAAILAAIWLNLWHFGLLKNSLLSDKKDAIDAASKILTTVTLVIGAIVSYFKFFHGRTLANRIELSITCNVIAAPSGKKFVAGVICAKNVGTTTIWNPAAAVRVSEYRESEEGASNELTAKSNVAAKQDSVPVIDQGETEHFSFELFVDPAVWAVRISAEVKCDTGDSWHLDQIVSTVQTLKLDAK